MMLAPMARSTLVLYRPWTRLLACVAESLADWMSRPMTGSVTSDADGNYSIELPAGSFDLVVMNHVLEHTTNPLSTLERARDIHKDEGHVLVVVPNYRSFDTRVKDLLSRFKLKSRPYKHLALGHHNFVFSINSLKALGQAAQLEVVYHATRQPAWRSSALHRVFENFELAAWCWIVYRKSRQT